MTLLSRLRRRSAPAEPVAEVANPEAFVAPTLDDVELALLEPARPTGCAFVSATELTDSPVELGVFDWVVDWADAVHAGAANYRGEWAEQHPLVRFGEHFWMDMCRAVFDWPAAKLPHIRRAVKLLMHHEEQELAARGGNAVFSDELAAMMVYLEDWLRATRDPYCTYQDPNAVFVYDDPHTHRELAWTVNNTCEATADWAASVGLADLELEARRAVEALKRAL